jgi:2-polyprenyl-3-methyl-5-hydroxy-6-metoxy-1,4-benzoquinol methylase
MIKSFIVSKINRFKEMIYISKLNKINYQEYVNQSFSFANERPVEFSFVFKKISQLYPKSILDVGTGKTSLPHLMYNCNIYTEATDNISDYWVKGMINRHYYVINDDITKTKLNKKYDLITCISVLEHITDFNAAVENMAKLLTEGGHLILTFPYNEKKYIKNAYALPGSSYGQNFPFITQIYSRAELDKWISSFGFEIVDQEFWEFWSGDYWTVGNIILPPKKVSAQDKHHHSCLLLKKTNVK